MRALALCLSVVLTLLAGPTQPARAQSEAETAALAARFPAARYGTFAPQAATRTALTEHRTWRLTIGGRWRWPATVRAATRRTDGRVLQMQPDALRPLGVLPPAGSPAAARGAALAETYLAGVLPPGAPPAARVTERAAVWYVADSASGAERAGWLLTWGHPDSRIGAWQVVLDEATGQPAGPPRSLLCYHHSARVELARRPLAPRTAAVDTTIRALVFRPDPLTSAQQSYGRPFIDSLDADRPALNQQRYLDTLWLTFEGDSFRLKNQWVEVVDFDPPARPVAAAATATGLWFGRADAGFEQVNALYHLTRARQYLGQLGYGHLHQFPIRVDAHGLSGADQSRFSPIDTTLSFGEGGVDDAEDADVVVHEYLHALASLAAPGASASVERRTLDEGNADYWAAVHSARLGGPAAYGREQVFNWDGHNEFWGGRWVISSKLYPRDLAGNPYLDADVWSATLWQIRADLPAAAADRLFLQHLYAYTPTLTMPDAARLLLQADTLLYGAVHAAAIFRRFNERHILGTHVVVGEGELSEGAPTPVLRATDAFARGEAARFRAAQPVHLALLTATGAVVWQAKATADAEALIPGAGLAPGLYVLRWQTAAGAGAARLVRW